MATNATTATVSCHFSANPEVHASPVTASLLVQVGATNQPGGVNFLHTCKDCANHLNGERENQLEAMRNGTLQNAHVMDVVIVNLMKAHFLEKAGRNNGVGLEDRSNGKRVCSSIQWDGSACQGHPEGYAVAFGGKVFDLCPSCAVAAKVVSTMTGIAEISPIPRALAEIRAKRQDDERKARKAKPIAATKPAPAAQGQRAPSPFALAVTVPVAPRPTGPQGLRVTRHLNG